MGLWSSIKSLFSTLVPATKGTEVRGTYDAAQTTTENENHWAATDSLNANAANSPAVRQTLRERARYERDNNAHCGDLVEKIAYDMVGSGPRLQLRIPGADRAVARRIETAFAAWARLIGLARKLRAMHESRLVDGEAFALLITNPRLPSDGVQLDVRLYETDQVDTPFISWVNALEFPGGRIDEYGNVVEWHLLKIHPGSNVWAANYLDFDRVPAERVLHWYKARRPGQLRGVSEIAAALPLFAYLRRYTLATISAAEIAAMLAGVMESGLAPDGSGPVAAAQMDALDLVRGALLTLPAGWSAKQFEPKQPVTGYREFKGEVLTETGASVGAPRNISTGSSAEYNYSSGRLDHLPYQRRIRTLRNDLRDQVIDRLFRAWLDEATLLPGLIPEGLPLRAAWSWDWYWDGFDSIDPQKDASTDEVELRNNTTTLAEIYARKGLDWEEQLDQRALELARIAALPASSTTVPAATPAQETASEDAAATAG